MSKVKRLAAATAALSMIIGVGLLPQGPAAAQDTSDQRVVFTLGDDNDLDSMNPFVGVEAPAFLMYALNYDLLVNFSSEDLSPAPGLAESWETSDDGLTWTFDIREGVTWHDGEPFTANDVAYTYNRVLDENIGCCKSYLRLVERVEAVDDTTLVIETARPTPLMLSIYIYILPEHIWSDISAEERKTFENYPDPVGTGPFRVVEWEKGQFFRMEANPDYWAGAPQVDEVVYRIFNNEDALVQALRAGEVDFADTLGAGLYDSLVGQEGIGTNEAAIPSFDEIGFNTGADAVYGDQSDGHPALKDVVVRQAISHAIDRQTLLDRVLLGHGIVGSTIVPPAIAFYHYQPAPEELFEFDPAEANRLLDEAGYADTDGDGVREMPGGGEALRFRYFVRSEDNSTVTASEFISRWLSDIGIATDVQALTDTRLTNVIYDGKYDMFHWGWFPDPDPDFILSVMSCSQRPPDGIWSDSFYCDQEYDRMYLEQKSLLDPDERAELIKEMQRQVYLDAPYVVLYYDTSLQAYRSDRWTGFVQQPAGDGDLLAAYGPFSFISLRPLVVETATPEDTGTGGGGATEVAGGRADDGPGPSAGLLIALAVGVAAILGVVGWLRYRRRTEEDRA